MTERRAYDFVINEGHYLCRTLYPAVSRSPMISCTLITLINRLQIPFYHPKVPVRRLVTEQTLKYLVSWLVLIGGESLHEKTNTEFTDSFILHNYILSSSREPGTVLAVSDAEMRKTS